MRGKTILSRLNTVIVKPFADLLRLVGQSLAPAIEDIPPEKLTFSGRGTKVSLFSRQFASMATSGVPLVQALDVLSEQEEDPRFRHCLCQIAGQMCSGYSLSKAMSAYSKIFPPVFPYLIRAGENTGRISQVLDKLASLLEDEVAMTKKVKSALSYPVFIMGLTGVLTLIIFTTVLPSFQDFYDGMDLELPLITTTLMAATRMVTSGLFWLIAILVVGTLAYLLKASWQVKSRRLMMFSMFLKIPMLGSIVEMSCLARYCWVLELTTNSGVDLMRSLRLASLASGSEILEADNERIVEGITNGETLNELVGARPDIYPNFLRQMVMLGEETSQLSKAFGRAADWFRSEVESRLDVFHATLEPLLMGIVSFIVGGIIVSVFLPLYGILEKLA